MRLRDLVAGTLTLTVACLGGPALAQDASAPNPDSFYRLGPDSLEQDGVPKGEIRGPFTLPSAAYPGTQHTYWVYVPAQYTSTEPASLMIFNDGQAFKNPTGNIRAHNVLDNLIYRREIPVMLAVFINPGRTPEQPEPTPQNWGDRDTNRPTGHDGAIDAAPASLPRSRAPSCSTPRSTATSIRCWRWRCCSASKAAGRSAWHR